MEKLGKHRWSLRLYGGVIAVLIAGVNTIWGGIAADWASYYFTAFNFLVGPIFIAITGKNIKFRINKNNLLKCTMIFFSWLNSYADECTFFHHSRWFIQDFLLSFFGNVSVFRLTGKGWLKLY